jgi:hypothetical protein
MFFKFDIKFKLPNKQEVEEIVGVLLLVTVELRLKQANGFL